MQPARFRAHPFRHGGGEGDDVVLHFGFDLVDARQVEAALFANGLGCRLRNDSGFGQRFRGGDFHLQPRPELVFVTPDVPHLGTGIASDQASSFTASNVGQKKTLYCNCWHKVRAPYSSETWVGSSSFHSAPAEIVECRCFPSWVFRTKLKAAGVLADNFGMR